MYIWRFPVQFAAVLITTAALLVLLELVSAGLRHTANVFVVALLRAATIVAFAGSPFLVDALVLGLNTTSDMHRVFIDQGAIVNWSAAAFAILIGTPRMFLFPGGDVAGRAWRSTFTASAFAYLAICLANRCAPGWCATFGVPLAWYSWSDALLEFNGERSSPFHPVGLAVDVAIVVVASGVATRTYRGRKRSAKTAA